MRASLLALAKSIYYVLYLCSKKTPEYPSSFLPYSMLGHVTTITHNNLVLSKIDPGGGGTSTRAVKSGNLLNIFEDDCI